MLIDEVKAADDDIMRVFAVIWTWLERHPVELGSLRDKYSMIVSDALATELEELKEPVFEGFRDKTLRWLAEDPLRNAARLLAQIDETVGENPWPEIEPTSGVEEAEVLVAWRGSELVSRLIPDDLFSSKTKEYPTPAALVRWLMVCPRVENQIELVVLEPDGDGWDRAVSQMASAVAQEDRSDFWVHHDTLGDHGLSEPVLDSEREVGRFDPNQLSEDAQDRCVEAAKAAVEEAARAAVEEATASTEPVPIPASVLVMPELAATPTVLDAISAALRETDKAPVLTIVGLYHLIPEDQPEAGPLGGRTGWSEYVNEAVILGPDGEELWRHRKLTPASARVGAEADEEDAERSEDETASSEYLAIEDIRLGDVLIVVPTPLGTIATVICLDTFAEHARERIAKCPANVLFVPSLSRTVRMHRISLEYLVQPLPRIAFVCNRWMEPGSWNERKSRSFWAFKQKQSSIVIPPGKNPDEHPSFVFKLSEHEFESEDQGHSQ